VRLDLPVRSWRLNIVTRVDISIVADAWVGRKGFARFLSARAVARRDVHGKVLLMNFYQVGISKSTTFPDYAKIY